MNARRVEHYIKERFVDVDESVSIIYYNNWQINRFLISGR